MTTATATRTAKKQLVKIGKTTTLHVHHTFLYLSLSSLHGCDFSALQRCKRGVLAFLQHRCDIRDVSAAMATRTSKK